MQETTLRSITYFAAFVLFTISIVLWILTLTGWLITEPGFEPLNILAAAIVSSVGGLLALLRSQSGRDTPNSEALKYRPSSIQLKRSRRAMLEQVKEFWIRGVLEQSLRDFGLIALGFDKRLDTIQRPWDAVLRTLNKPAHSIPHGTKIISIFNAMNRSLLILGAPGSGKTTILLELARDAIIRAERDTELPIPVVFNLSSWVNKGQTISDWLVDELNAKYYVSERIARLWVENDDLLLLLDGLDEVRPDLREACVGAINDFRQKHGLAPLVVCSRTADYQLLTTRLELQGAILIRPLTPQQVDNYLASAGDKLLTLRKALTTDNALLKLAQTPLMLNIMIQTFHDKPDNAIPTSKTLEEYQKLLFDTYVERMLRHRRIDQRYESQHVIRWLAWLAQMMSKNSQSLFLLERIQPSWLQTQQQYWVYLGGSVLLVWLITTLFGVLVPGLMDVVEVLVFGVSFRPPVLSLVIFVSIISAGTTFAVLQVRGVDITTHIKTVEALNWSWILSKEKLREGLNFGIKWGLIGGVGFSLMIVFGSVISPSPFSLPLDWQIGTMAFVFFMILTMCLIGGISYGLFSGLTGKEIETKTVPNQGIRQSARNAAIAGTGFSLISWFVFALMVLSLSLILAMGAVLFLEGISDSERVEVFIMVVVTTPGTALFMWQFFGWGLGPFGAFVFGGTAVIQHFVLRLILFRKGYMPWDYVCFLDYATERVFLRRVGGGYIFVHRLLQDHFATLGQTV